MPDAAVTQVAALPLRIAGDDASVLLITSSAGRWILPKGHLDRGRTAPEMAAIEALEEAGVLGTPLEHAIGHYQYHRAETLHRVDVFPLLVERVLTRWKEQQQRRRLWLPLETAADRIQIPALARLVRSFAHDTEQVRAIRQTARRRRAAG